MRFGYVPNPKGHLRVPFSMHPAMRAGGAVTPSEVDLEPFMPYVFDQGPTESCTGHGTACGLFTSFNAAGTPIPFVPSPASLYKNGISLDRVPPFAPLHDEGAMPAMVTLAATETGLRPIGPLASDGRYSDADPATICDEPSLEELEVESLFVPFGEYAIQTADEQGLASLVAALRLALASRTAIGSGAFVDSAFMKWNASGPPMGPSNTSDPNGGLHWMCYAGYKTLPSGKTLFKKRNSWSKGWGLQGSIWLTEEAIANDSDLTVYSPKRAT